MTTTTTKTKTNKKIIIDVTVANLSIRGAKPEQQYQNMPMRTNDAGRII